MGVVGKAEKHNREGVRAEGRRLAEPARVGGSIVAGAEERAIERGAGGRAERACASAAGRGGWRGSGGGWIDLNVVTERWVLSDVGRGLVEVGGVG